MYSYASMSYALLHVSSQIPFLDRCLYFKTCGETANDMTQTGSFGLSRAAKKRAGAPEPASNSLLLKMAIEIVDLPKKMVIFHSYVCLPEG